MTKENDPKTAPVKHKDYPVDKLAELTRAIAESRAVIYLGAGASASAGLPSWNQLLKILRDAARPFMQEREQANEDQDHFEELFSKGKSLEAGDWLHHLLDTELKHILWSEFSEKVRDAQIKASPIHGNIVRAISKRRHRLELVESLHELDDISDFLCRNTDFSIPPDWPGCYWRKHSSLRLRYDSRSRRPCE